MDNTQDSIRAEISDGEDPVTGMLESQVIVQNNTDNSDGKSPRVMTDTAQFCTNDQVHWGSTLEVQEGGTIPMMEEELEQSQDELIALAERLRQNDTSPISPHVRPSSRLRGQSFVVQVSETSSSSLGSVQINSSFELKPATATQSSGRGTASEAREVKEEISNFEAGLDIPWLCCDCFPPCLFNDPTSTFDVFKAFDSSILVGVGQLTKSSDTNESYRDIQVEEVIQLEESAISPASTFHFGPPLIQQTFVQFSQGNIEGDDRLPETWSVEIERIIPEPEPFDTSSIMFADQMCNTLPSSLQEYLEEHLTESKNATKAMGDEETEADHVARDREIPENGISPGLTRDFQEHSAERQAAPNERSHNSQDHATETQGEPTESSAAQRASFQFGDVSAPEPVPLTQSMCRAQIAAISTDHIARPDPEHIRRTIMHYEQNVFYPMPAMNDYSTRQYYMSPLYHGLIGKQIFGRDAYSTTAGSSNTAMAGNSASGLGEQTQCEDRRRGRGANGRCRVRGRGRVGRGPGY